MKLVKLHLFCIFLLIANVAKSQWNHQLEFNSTILGQANSAIGGQTVITKNGEITSKDNRYSLGSGNEFGLFFTLNNDSSDIFFGGGINYFQGGRNLLSKTYHQDSMIESFITQDAAYLAFTACLGFRKVIKNKWEFGGMMGVRLPFWVKIREDIQYSKGDYTEQTRWDYRTNFLPGFMTQFGGGFHLSENLIFRTGFQFSFMNLFEKKAKIITYQSTNNQTLEERYPTVSDREILFKSELKEITNEPILFPDTFDPNQPAQSLSRSLPFSSIGITFGIAWQFGSSKKDIQ